MKVRISSGERFTHYDGTWCSIWVHLDGTGQVLLGFPDDEGHQVRRPATIPDVWDFLEGAEGLDRDELDAWVMSHLVAEPPAGI